MYEYELQNKTGCDRVIKIGAAVCMHCAKV